MKDRKFTAGSPLGGRCVIVVLAAILAVLFWRSFLPDYVHFSNDGPLGQQNVAWARMPACITGMWCDVNYIGFNEGTISFSISALLHFITSPVGFAKFYPAVTLLLLGFSAWVLFWQLRLSPLAALFGALAAMLNSTFFSSACWGVASQEIAAAMDFFALALIVGCATATPALLGWTRFALAGLCVGMNVIEAADIGALFSLLIAIFVLIHSLVEGHGAVLGRVFRGVGRVMVVAGFAGFIALQTVLSLVGNSIQGVAGTAQDSETKAQHWDWATQWSLPKVETVGLLVPGLFGYKMDTPKDMMPALQDAYRNGVYWGGVGRDPALDRYFDAGSEGTPPSGFMRFTGGGNYCGTLVLLVAAWAIAQSLRRKLSPFSSSQQRMIQFWAVVMLFCLLFAWGRFAPFYALLYQLPYFSTIRNPAKFLIFFSWATVIIFGYGVHALNGCYLNTAARPTAGFQKQISNWWSKAGGFDRRWAFVSLGLLAACVAGWMIYGAKQADLIQYLQKVGFSDPDPTHDNSAPAIAAFSLGQLGWFLVLFAAAVGLLLVVISGYFNGSRTKTGALLLGGFMLFDLGRANLPWVVHWNYKQKYEVGSLNPILEALRETPYEHRVAGLPFEPQQQLRGYDYLFGGSGLYRIEWVQHQFPYYDIQTLDVVQMPRPPEDMKAYMEALAPRPDPATYPLIAREWLLTNTRYLLGAASFLDVLNQELDPAQHRFKLVQRFDLDLKPGVNRLSQLEQLAAVPNPDGDLALFEFTGALPRAKLYSNWQVNTNDRANLKTLADLGFDPARTVLVSTPEPGLPAVGTNDNSGSVEYRNYQSKNIVLSARTTAPSVLLLNDKFDPSWQVTVDGKPARLLRCNFIMRGVFLPAAGEHTVVFSFSQPLGRLYLTLSAILVGVGLGIVLFCASRRRSVPAA